MNLYDIAQRPLFSEVFTVTVEGRAVLLPVGCRVKPMGRVMRFFAGSLTPGMTTPGAIYLNENLLPLLTVETVCHEATHWWQANKRMGPWSYTLTYYWHLLLTAIVRRQGIHWHDTHMMEAEARMAGREMARMSGYFSKPLDTQDFLSGRFPALR